MIGAGIMVSDWTTFCGSDTTTTGLSVIESVFMPRDSQPSVIGDETSESFIDGYV